ncbi:DUF362 domain-containing protein [Massilimaliae timonensis]|uniref:Ferredoxin n=1 Tax=Massiliimalia timonensis TaxID=1987501 RepID=A0A8J6P5C3_9FIRM|nr:DUF362 domain-containing protein [Massiliimalia timonensis]MBC8611538.1 DUF362 domain-containing protein [Massiliimalia timonensis]
MSMITVTHTPTYELKQVQRDVAFHLEQFHIAGRITPEMRVLIKPNLLMKRRPEEFTTTHPSLVEAVICYLKEAGIHNITVADSPGGLYTAQALKGIYDVSGMTEVCQRQQVNLNFTTDSREVRREENKLVKSFPLIQPVCEADFIIDIAKLKTHAMTGLSGAVKNLFGCIPGLTKPEFHWRFPEKELFGDMLIDLCETVRPGFALVDGVHAMEGDGPSGGDKRELHMIAASDHLYDLDLFLCHVIGADPQKICMVKSAIDRRLCCGDLQKLDIIGDVPQAKPFAIPQDKGVDFMGQVPAPLRGVTKKFVNRFFTSRPVIRKRDCIGCGKCAQSCPAKTIRIQDKKAVISYQRCIHCFCCHEMCPVKAIDIKRTKLFDH